MTTATRRLPDPLLVLGDTRVAQGREAGDFYCEHLLFMALGESQRPQSSFCRDATGAPLVGFLHVPPDADCYDAANLRPAAERQRQTRAVVGKAIASYITSAAPKCNGTVRLLITGFGPFGPIKNNPTGAFVSSADNLLAALQAGFGADRVTALGQGSGAERFLVRLGRSSVTVMIWGQLLPVNDSAIDGRSPHAIQTLCRTLAPHALLCLGVGAAGDYVAETRADSGGLVLEPYPHHDDTALPNERDQKTATRKNLSLARALAGVRPAVA
jgi:hypothetical protein